MNLQDPTENWRATSIKKTLSKPLEIRASAPLAFSNETHKVRGPVEIRVELRASISAASTDNCDAKAAIEKTAREKYPRNDFRLQPKSAEYSADPRSDRKILWLSRASIRQNNKGA